MNPPLTEREHFGEKRRKGKKGKKGRRNKNFGRMNVHWRPFYLSPCGFCDVPFTGNQSGALSLVLICPVTMLSLVEPSYAGIKVYVIPTHLKATECKHLVIWSVLLWHTISGFHAKKESLPKRRAYIFLERGLVSTTSLCTISTLILICIVSYC